MASGVQSHLREFCQALGHPQDTLFVMLRLLGDRSASERFTVVAGWLGPLPFWEQAEASWSLVLAKYDVPYFHMKEFAPSVGPFEKWKHLEGTRRGFLTELAAVIHESALYGTAAIIEHRVFDEVNRDYEIKEYFKEYYALCATSCMALANRQRRANFPDHDIEYIFERGDPGAGHIVELCGLWKNQTPSFKPGRPSEGRDREEPIIGLQAADFAAWELHKAAKTLGPDHPFFVYRRSLQVLTPRHFDWQQYSHDDLVGACGRFGISRRSGA